MIRITALAIPYFEHLAAASRAHSLGRRLAILHGDGLGILDIYLRSALYTISLHFTLLYSVAYFMRTLSCLRMRLTS